MGGGLTAAPPTRPGRQGHRGAGVQPQRAGRVSGRVPLGRQEHTRPQTLRGTSSAAPSLPPRPRRLPGPHPPCGLCRRSRRAPRAHPSLGNPVTAHGSQTPSTRKRHLTETRRKARAPLRGWGRGGAHSLCHDASHVVGVQGRVLLLLLRRSVHGQELSTRRSRCHSHGARGAPASPAPP